MSRVVLPWGFHPAFCAFLLLLCLSSSQTAAVDLHVVTDSAVTADSAASSVHTPGAVSRHDSTGAPVKDLGTVSVTATRQQRLIETSHSLAVINADEWTGTGKSIADVLQQQSGIQTRRYGGTGYLQTISIRGVPGTRVTVCIDGVPLNSAMGGAVDLGKINPERIEEIDVHKGVTPALYGGNGLGGVIDLRTKRPGSAAHGVHLMAGGGSYGRLDAAVNAYKHFDSLATVGVYLAYQYSDNSFRYLDRNNTVTISDDDRIRRVTNGRYGNFDAAVSGDIWRRSGAVLSSRVEHVRIQSGIPAGEGGTNRTAGYTTNSTVVDLRYSSSSLVGARLELEPRLNIEVKTGETHCTGGDDFGYALGSLQPGEYAGFGFDNMRGIGALRTKLSPFDWLTVDGLLSLTGEDFKPTTRIGGLLVGEWPGRQARGSLALSTDIVWPLTGLGLTLDLSGEGIYTRTDGGSDTYFHHTVLPGDTVELHAAGRAGARWTGPAGLLLFANAARYYRPASLHERYGAMGMVLPNPELADEAGVSVDCGAKIKLRRLYAEVLGYYNTLTNGIYFHNDGHASFATNLGGAVTYGAEINVTARVLKLLEIENHLTIQSTENTSDISYYKGKLLPNEPPLTDAFFARLGPWHGLLFEYGFVFKSAYYLDEANVRRMPYDPTRPGTLLHNLRFRWDSARGLDAAVTVKNVTDFVSEWQDVPGSHVSGYEWSVYPGRELYVELGYRF